MVSNLLLQFVWIACLRARPQDVTAGRSALIVAIAVNLVTYVLAVSSTRAVPSSLMLALADLAVSGLCLYVAVSVVNKNARFEQAFTALCGGTAVLNLVAIPALWLGASSESTIIALFNIVIIFWGLAIIAHVLRHTLEVSQLFSVALAMVFYVVVLNLLAITGVIGELPEPSDTEQQLSIYQSLSLDWSGKA